MTKAVWITQGDFIFLQVRNKMQIFFLSFSHSYEMLLAIQNAELSTKIWVDKPLFPSTCIGKNHRLGGNFSKFFILSPFLHPCIIQTVFSS